MSWKSKHTRKPDSVFPGAGVRFVGHLDIRATEFDTFENEISRKLLGVRDPHFRDVFFGTRAACATGYVHIMDNISYVV